MLYVMIDNDTCLNSPKLSNYYFLLMHTSTFLNN